MERPEQHQPQPKRMPQILRRRIEAEEEANKSDKKQRGIDSDFEAHSTGQSLTAQASEPETPSTEHARAVSPITISVASESGAEKECPDSSQQLLDMDSLQEV